MLTPGADHASGLKLANQNKYDFWVLMFYALSDIFLAIEMDSDISLINLVRTKWIIAIGMTFKIKSHVETNYNYSLNSGKVQVYLTIFKIQISLIVDSKPFPGAWHQRVTDRERI